MDEDEFYESVIVAVEGSKAIITTIMNGIESSTAVDEDVDDWSDQDLKNLASDMVECDPDEVDVLR